MSYLVFDPDLRSSQDDAVLQFCDTAFELLSTTGLSAAAGCPVMPVSLSAVIASSFLAGHPLPGPRTGDRKVRLTGTSTPQLYVFIGAGVYSADEV